MFKMQTGWLAGFLVTAAAVVSVRAETPAPAPTGWQSSASAGMTLTRGNSDTLLAVVGATTAKKWDKNELNFGADGMYGETKDNGQTIKNAESVHGFGQYNRLFTERLYGFVRVEGLHDGVADIKYRATLAPGLGYYLIKEKKTDLSVEFGPAFIAQQLGDDTSKYVALRFAEKFHHQLSDRARIWQSAEYLPKIDDFNNYILNTEVGIEADLTQDRKLTIRSYVQDTYNNVPAAGRERNDAKLVTAISYKF